jgi:protein-L-isoaspartate O-methyltransferase
MRENKEPIDWKADSLSFNNVASDYDTYRPSYPNSLIEDTINLTDLSTESSIMEIGCGTGKATILFARHGFMMHCIDPGSNLVDTARRNLKSYKHVSFEVTDFEGWQNKEEPFDIVYSAQAWHWVNLDIGYTKACQALKSPGYLVLFWNLYPDPQSAIFQELSKVYQEYAPELVIHRKPYQQMIRRVFGDINGSGCFCKPTIHYYHWSEMYTTRDYLGLLNTYSDHLRLPLNERIRLFNHIGYVIEKHGGEIKKPYLSVLFVSQKLS